MYYGHQSLAKCVQTSTERGEDAVAVARIESAVGQGWLPWRPGARHLRRHLWHRSLPRCCHRPWAVAAVCRSGYNQLRQLRPVVRSLSMNATKTPVQAFISCRLDYCNSLLYGVSARRTTSTPPVGAERCRSPGYRRPSYWPVLRQLHSLPVRQRVAFKIAGLVHQSLAGAAPAYLADDCHPLSDAGRRPLRSHSNEIRKLLVPRIHNKLGDRSFSAAGPRLWNDFPPGLRRPGLPFDSFRRSLKTHLFGDWSA